MFSVFIFLFYFLINLSQAALQPNDVSILLPLPQATQWNELLKPDTAATLGQLLPQEFFLKKIPPLLQSVDNAVMYPDLRVVAIRLDPCFTEGTSVECRRQIRLIWQPLVVDNSQTSTRDITLHSFYDLSADEMSLLLQQVEDLKNLFPQTAQQTLGPNPLITSQGLSGPYWQKLKILLLHHIGEKNLSRVTFMRLFANESVWFFGGLNIINNVATPIVIPRIENKIQQFINTAQPLRFPESFNGRIFPADEQDDSFNRLLRDSEHFTSEEDIVAAMRSSLQFENPLRHNPGTLDCVSCHAAQQAKNYLYRHFDFLNNSDFSADTYTSQNSLINSSPLQNNTAVLRMFGYYQNQAFVAQRVINETDQVLKFLNQR